VIARCVGGDLRVILAGFSQCLLQTDHRHPGGVIAIAPDTDAGGERVEVGDLVG
jgi:hypothetical protein